ncbi:MULTISPECIES: enhanced serine sensitivity protein SseB C-terminal domain-containing protein [unclassified Streptomyces]|uniref:enhanced serine sensitivity protein SseB C-terminal domain-containing protein n=1 Tax=unclassified Streptomyces TaxID=2593676 RepID=UPI00190497B3|nr:enhanced serine sensitivity protein SseB C-terminal domain-containing protein [Streptomyces sp. HSG2]
MSASGTAAGSVEQMLRQVTPGRYEAYEALLRALAVPGSGRVWMLLWEGQEGSPDARYAGMEVAGSDYVPCVTSARELSASGWDRSYEVADGLEAARSLFPTRTGVWLNPHAPGGGVGVPWPDLRRVASGLERRPAGPLRLSHPTVSVPQFYALLTHQAHRTPAVRTLRRAWVQPALGGPYLAIGLEVYDTSPPALDTVRTMMRQSVGTLPEGLPLSTVPMSDAYDPVAMWLRANARPFYDREAHGAPAAGAGQGYPAAPGRLPGAAAPQPG